MGVVALASPSVLSRIPVEFIVASHMTKSLPWGSVSTTKCCNATFRRSGRMQRNTSSFLNGSLSRRAQSNGSFSVSGVTWLNHSMKRVGASCRSAGSFPNSSMSASACNQLSSNARTNQTSTGCNEGTHNTDRIKHT